MITVTGAAGQLGRGTIRHLLDRKPADRLLAVTRDPSRVADLAARGVAIRQADFADPDALTAALAGTERLLVISVDRFGEEARRLHRAAFQAAVGAGVQRFFYTSHMGAAPTSAFADHAAAEDDLSAIGVPFTSLRHGFYAESALHLIGRGLETGDIRVPEDGPVSWTARADLAEADALLLAGDARFDGITPPLVATEALTMAGIAALASEITGRPITRTVVGDDEWRAQTIAQGVPPPLADALLGMYRSTRRGDLASADPTLSTLLGRPPRSMREVLAGALATGKAR